MRRSVSAAMASLSALFLTISVQSASEVISYFSRNRSSEKILSRFLQQSATNAAPTSLLSGTATPRRVTVSSRDLGVRIGLLGVATSFALRSKPGIGLGAVMG